MNTNEIMVNGEVIEVTEEIATAGSRKGIKVAVGVGLVVLGGVATYKYIIKPMVATIKAIKEQLKMDAEFDVFEDAEIDE